MNVSEQDLVVCSFYTPTWTYPESARRLTEECDALGLEHVIRELPDQGTYLRNCRLKPGFILGLHRELARPLLWVDVDASILQPPNDLDSSADFMARPMQPDRPRHWHVGSLFFNRTAAAGRLLALWVAALETGKGSDEWALDEVWRSGEYHPLRYANLPRSYFEVVVGTARPSTGTVIVHRLSSSPSKRRMRAQQRRR